jgi:hypothetical protein
VTHPSKRKGNGFELDNDDRKGGGDRQRGARLADNVQRAIAMCLKSCRSRRIAATDDDTLRKLNHLTHHWRELTDMHLLIRRKP